MPRITSMHGDPCGGDYRHHILQLPRRELTKGLSLAGVENIVHRPSLTTAVCNRGVWNLKHLPERN
jgi:hypothetical protein